jgi:hypothetical protein
MAEFWDTGAFGKNFRLLRRLTLLRVTLIGLVIDAIKDIPDPGQFEESLTRTRTINGKVSSLGTALRQPTSASQERWARSLRGYFLIDSAWR